MSSVFRLSITAACIGVTIYLIQVQLSRFWLGRFQFGPFEWLWRSLTYGRRQPMRRRHPCLTGAEMSYSAGGLR